MDEREITKSLHELARMGVPGDLDGWAAIQNRLQEHAEIPHQARNNHRAEGIRRITTTSNRTDVRARVAPAAMPRGLGLVPVGIIAVVMVMVVTGAAILLTRSADPDRQDKLAAVSSPTPASAPTTRTAWQAAPTSIPAPLPSAASTAPAVPTLPSRLPTVKVGEFSTIQWAEEVAAREYGAPDAVPVDVSLGTFVQQVRNLEAIEGGDWVASAGTYGIPLDRPVWLVRLSGKFQTVTPQLPGDKRHPSDRLFLVRDAVSGRELISGRRSAVPPTAPQPKTGADVLALGSDVRYLQWEQSPQGRSGKTRVRTIKAPREVARLMRLLLEAPVNTYRLKMYSVMKMPHNDFPELTFHLRMERQRLVQSSLTC